MDAVDDLFRRRGYVHLPGAFSPDQLLRLESECVALYERASRLLAVANAGQRELAALYRDYPDEPIVVPEAGRPEQVCRMEYVAGCSAYFRAEVVARLSARIRQELGQEVVLFKDKCNVKQPNGGGYPPHQDITAYRHFGPLYHITAAVMLDPATAVNGCLEMARDYLQHVRCSVTVNTPYGRRPILPSYVSGPHNGDIVAEVAEQFDWHTLEASPGDVIVFDSFVPHRSQPNRSTGSRRILFFTFNLVAEGDHYAAYYRSKRTNPTDPMFHVSTPTAHSKQEDPAAVVFASGQEGKSSDR